MSTPRTAGSGSAQADVATAGFGVAAVFWTTLSTILGAILFLRMGYAVGNLGLVGCLFVIVLGHLVTIPAALAVAEIATNQKVAGDGDLTMVGMRREAVRRIGADAFGGYDEVGNIAFVIGVSDVEIERDEQVAEPQEVPREALRADADESASEDHLARSATGLASA